MKRCSVTYCRTCAVQYHMLHTIS